MSVPRRSARSDRPPPDPSGRLERLYLMGLVIDAIDLEQAAARIGALMAGPGLAHVVTANLDYLAQIQRDGRLAEVVERADLVVADGVPLLWMARWTGRSLPGRVNGTDLTFRLLETAGPQAWPVAILGGDPGVAEAAGRVARRRWSTPVAGTWPLSREEVADPQSSRLIAAEVGSLGKALILVGLGGGRQDLWIDRHRHLLGDGVVIGVGSALDFVAGTRPRAPLALQRAGLEWFWRLGQEPTRLWRRYLVEDLGLLVRFASTTAKDRLRLG